MHKTTKKMHKTTKKTHTTAKKRKHAALIRITARERNDDELPLALAYADRLEAEADLADALAGVEPATADYAHLEQVVPILGTIVYSGGVIISVDHAWTKAHDDEARRRGIMLAWQWVRPLHSPAAGTCSDFFAGTRDSGPLVHWSASDGCWRRCSSEGNYGENWACGGAWHTEQIKPNSARPEGAMQYGGQYVYQTFEACHPDLCQAIKDILNSQIRQDSARVAKATAKVEAARLRQNAATHRYRANCYRSQASLAGQETESASKAADEDELADMIEARAAEICI